jgi:hypothetical protein
MKISQNVVNDVTYKNTKFQYEILYIMGYTKITNYGKICRFENIHNGSIRLSFLCSPKYKAFECEFLHVCEINSGLHLNIFFTFF